MATLCPHLPPYNSFVNHAVLSRQMATLTATNLLILQNFTQTIEYFKYAQAEKDYYCYRGAKGSGNPSPAASANKTSGNPLHVSLSEQINCVRQLIKSSIPEPSEEDMKENIVLRQKVEELEGQVKSLEERVRLLELGGSKGPVAKALVAKAPVAKEDEDEVDLFASDEEEDAEAEKVKQQRLAEYAAKKSKKPALVAKSNVILDVKPWDDETDMGELEKAVRSVQMEGLLWGVSKLVPVGYGIKKLQINTVIVDDLVSVDELTEKLEAFEDFVQSVDIAAFNKI